MQFQMKNMESDLIPSYLALNSIPGDWFESVLCSSRCVFILSLMGAFIGLIIFYLVGGRGKEEDSLRFYPPPPPLLGCMSRDQVGIVPISWISVRLIPIRNSIRSGSLRFWDGNTPRFFGIFGDSLASTGSEDLWVKLLMVGGGERGG